MRNTSDQKQNEYINDLFQFENEALRWAKQESDRLQLSRISISAGEARTLQFFLQTWKVKKHIEIGTLTGYSAVAAAQALGPGGQVWTFEKNQNHIEAAQRVFAKEKSQSGSSAEIYLCCGDAQVELEKISNQGPFDSIFIDGNKGAYGSYLSWAEKNIRQGGLILADNVFLSGSVYEKSDDSRFSDKQIKVLQEFNQRLADPQLYRSCLVPTFEGLFVAEKLF